MTTWEITPFYRSDTGAAVTVAHLDIDYSIISDDTSYKVQVNSATYRNTNSNGEGTVRAYTGGLEVVLLNASGTVMSSYTTEFSMAKGTKTRTWSFTKSYTVTKTQATQSNAISIGVSIVLQNSNIDYMIGRGLVGGASGFSGVVKKYFSVPAKTYYNVAYAANGGSSTPTTQKKWYNENLKLSGAISKASSSPGNYTVTLNGNGVANPTALTSKRTTTYAFSKWKATNGTLYNAGATYSTNAGTTMTAQWTTTETRASVTFPTLSRAGYSFGGWGSSSTASSASYAGGATLAPASNLTYYAIWKRTITYDGNAQGAGNVPSSQTAIAASATTLSSAVPTRSGYVFKGWGTAKNAASATYSAGGSYPAQQPNITLYAVWESTVRVASLLAVRCDSEGNDDDEGTYARLTFSWQAYDTEANNPATVSVRVNGSSTSVATATLSGGTYNSSTGYRSGSASLTVPSSGSGIFDTEEEYSIEVVVTDTRNGSASSWDILSRAYFTMDILGDKYYYQPTDDSSYQNGKTYYTLTGGEYVAFTGSSFSSGTTYYEKTGPRPGHGVAFGTSAKKEGLCVAMPAEFESTVTLGNGSESADTIKYRGPYSTDEMIRFLPNDDPNTYGPGSGLSMGGGGLVVIGSGESAENYRVAEALPPGTESMHIASDNDITLAPGCQTVANRAYVKASSTASYYPVLTLKSGPSHVAAVNTTSNNSYSDSVYLARIAFQSKNDVESGSIGNRTENGAIRSFLAARNEKTDGTFVENWLSLFVNKDGSRSYSVSDASAFRNAIGANTSGIWPVSIGGTGLSDFGTISDPLTGSTTNTSTSSYTKLGQYTLAAGKWLVAVGCYCAYHATGSRAFTITTSDTTPTSVSGRLNTYYALGGTTMYNTLLCIQNVGSQTTYRVWGWQNSGTTLGMSVYVRTMKIG